MTHGIAPGVVVPTMNRRDFLLTSTAAGAVALTGCESPNANPNALVGRDRRSVSQVFEMRIYHPAPGKAAALHARFRDHTVNLFRRHGMENVGYWNPVDPADERLFYLLGYPSREARDASWKAFGADPEWQAAWKASEVDGKLVARVESTFHQLTDYSPALRAGNVSRGGVFEFRAYTTPPGRLANLDARFRDHTVALFARHGMNNWGYFHRLPGQPAADVTLEYFLTHASREAAAASFAAFREDPDWIAARKASEARAGGSLTADGGVKSLFLRPTDYSATR